MDWPWSPDGKLGAPFRANIHTKKWFIMMGAKSERQSKSGWFQDKYRHITWQRENPDIYARLHSMERHSKFWSGRCACDEANQKARGA